MKSRIAVTLMLVFGVGLSTTGAGLAVTGSSGQGSAAQVVYNQPNGTTPLNPTPTTQPTPQGTPQPQPTPPAATPTPPAATPRGEVIEGQAPTPAPEDEGDVRGAQDESAESAPVSPVRVADQAEVADTTTGDSLPFTGFSAIPVLLAGLALMVGGLFMHRRTSAGRL